MAHSAKQREEATSKYSRADKLFRECKAHRALRRFSRARGLRWRVAPEPCQQGDPLAVRAHHLCLCRGPACLVAISRHTAQGQLGASALAGRVVVLRRSVASARCGDGRFHVCFFSDHCSSGCGGLLGAHSVADCILHRVGVSIRRTQQLVRGEEAFVPQRPLFLACRARVADALSLQKSGHFLLLVVVGPLRTARVVPLI
jgi:hypothetical protein